MQNKSYPLFSSHLAALCFHCDAHIGDKGNPINYGFPKGRYGSWCNDCHLRTYYDTDDKSLKFDKKGDVLPQTCSCGCTVPRDEWKTEYSYPQCPDCAMI